jgi:3-deoxy-manno-octulosonate cytidylyltransferase (CMP-KDO synthetase)
VVTDRKGRALYFSRAPIPLVRDDPGRQAVKGLHYIHLGIYIYTRETLLRLASLAPGHLEEAEKLEQLRALDHGIGIHVWETQHASLRIDTPADARSAGEALRRLASNKPLETSNQL